MNKFTYKRSAFIGTKYHAIGFFSNFFNGEVYEKHFLFEHLCKQIWTVCLLYFFNISKNVIMKYFSRDVTIEFFPGFPHSSVSEESSWSEGDTGFIPGLGRSTGEGNVNLLQYSCLENPMDREACWATVHEISKVGCDLATKPPPFFVEFPFTFNKTLFFCDSIIKIEFGKLYLTP